MSTLIEVQHVSKHFSLNQGTATILSNINLQVAAGEFVAILGPSGSGKSTLLRIIAGLVEASSGQVTYLGAPVQGVNPGVAMVFQSFALFPWLTVLENVLLGLEGQNLPLADKKAKALSIIDIVGLDGFETAYPKELSGGMRQRVGIGRALVSDPAVLLMDEPFSALDVLTAENLRRDLLKLWLEGKIATRSIILVTHGIEEAVYMADRAIILSSGPAQVVENLPITLPRWRDKKDPAFLSLVDHIYSVMTKKPLPLPESPVHTAKKFTLLPLVSAEALTGFLELMEDLHERTDLYRLADRFMMDIEDFFPLVDFAALLHLARVVEGDIELTPAGSHFAQASVLERKELFRALLLDNIPFLQQLLSILESKSNHHMNSEFFEEMIARSVGAQAAEVQLRLLISWGRYAELFAYDQKSNQLYLETESSLT